MSGNRQIPADIFEEMAGMKDITPPTSAISDENIVSGQTLSPISVARLKDASVALSLHVQNDFVKSLHRVLKHIFKMRMSETEVSAQIETVIEHDERKDKERRVNPWLKLWNKIKPLIKAAWWGIKKIIKFIGKHLIKRLIKVAIKISKVLIKLFSKTLRALLKFAKNALKGIYKLSKKIIKFAFKTFKVLVKVFWRIVKKLFLRGKPMPKQFKGEPDPLSMEQPILRKGKNAIDIRATAPKKKSSFIFKAVKKFFKVITKFFFKFITKIFGKIIKMAIKVLVKFIVKFVAGQVIGSLLPGIGNLIMLGITGALLLYDLYGLVNFVKETSNEAMTLFKELKDDLSKNEIDEETEDFDIETLSISEVRKLVYEYENSGKTDSDIYIQAKKHYLELLSKEYERVGDTKGLEMILTVLEENNKENNKENKKPSSSIKTVEALLSSHQINKARELKKVKEENIFDNSEYKELLTGEVDGGPMWVAIWQNIMSYIQNNSPYKISERVKDNLSLEEIYPGITDKINEKLINESSKVKNNVDEANQKILNNNNSYNELTVDDFNDGDNLVSITEKSTVFKFDLQADSLSYQNIKKDEVNQQNIKTEKWLDILNLLRLKKQRSVSF